MRPLEVVLLAAGVRYGPQADTGAERAEAAEGLARWQGKRLSLGITELSAETAKAFVMLESDILSLSITELSAEAAEGLAGWKGDWLSLNSISELIAERQPKH